MVWSIVFTDLRRKAQYLSISGTCFVFHYALLRYQVRALGWRPEWLCNALAFEISAQVNFVLTRFITWGDRPDNPRRAWLIYNRTALVSLGLNTVGFQAAYRVCSTKIFRHDAQASTGQRQVPLPALTALPPSEEPRRLVVEIEHLQEREPGSLDGVTVLMPAKNESANLMGSVAGAVVAFRQAGLDCTVVVVDDGGSDGTPLLSRWIARKFPAYVVVAHHVDQRGQPFNQGYATAMNNGLDVAVRTGRRLIVTTDSDGQFRPADMVALAEYTMAERKDAVFGYRVQRADPLRRKLSGHAWTWLTRTWTHVRVRDADCALKAFDWRAASQFRLVGKYGMAGAELTAWGRALKLNVGQFPVHHLPRKDVENQTGGSLSVILGSFASLPTVYLNLVRLGHRWRRTRRLVRPLDPAAGAVTAVAGAMSLTSFLTYYLRGQTLLYADAMSHLTIARRVISNPTTGIAQLGTTWLPFTHLASGTATCSTAVSPGAPSRWWPTWWRRATCSSWDGRSPATRPAVSSPRRCWCSTPTHCTCRPRP
jgi:putative flippase GtrA